MRRSVRIYCAVALILVSGCASIGEPRQASVDRETSSLATRKLNPSECGLYVWRNTPDKDLVVFSSRREAAIFIDREVAFNPAETPLNPSQSFVVDEREWTLSLEQSEQIDGGIRYDGGTLRTVTDAGWDLVVPVLGLSICADAQASNLAQ